MQQRSWQENPRNSSSRNLMKRWHILCQKRQRRSKLAELNLRDSETCLTILSVKMKSKNKKQKDPILSRIAELSFACKLCVQWIPKIGVWRVQNRRRMIVRTVNLSKDRDALVIVWTKPSTWENFLSYLCRFLHSNVWLLTQERWFVSSCVTQLHV